MLEIQHSIQDQEWVTIVCGTTEVPNFPLQKSLIDYGNNFLFTCISLLQGRRFPLQVFL